MGKYNYEEIGLKVGLEIHQQLNSHTKLFCRCPNELQGSKEPDFEVRREMRPVLGEMGAFDKAMLTEYEKNIDIIYEGYNTSICTYELDETPPFSCNTEAKEIAAQISLLLNANIIPEMHVCRKNYLDGSVPCGFQRTMIFAKDGYVELENGKKIGIEILCLEEDAARKIKTEQKTNYFRLDRLGIPLVEVTTKPDISNPEEARDCAERLGLLLWSTNVKKVLGSIRQDVNVSIKDGTRIEIKGVQKLDWIPNLIDNEISRQSNLLKIKKELIKRNIKKQDLPVKGIDLNNELKKTSCKFIAKGIKSGKKVQGLNFPKFKGLFGLELMEDYRFGTEVSSKVKSISGLKGLIHSDEDLKKYSFSDNDIKAIEIKLKVRDEDCFVLIMGEKDDLEKAIRTIIKRVNIAFDGVPPETRKALENGETEFLRELHGGARLYPDTDLKPIINSEKFIESVRKNLPDYPWDIIKEYSKKYNTEERVVKELIFENKMEIFEKLLEIYSDNPTLILTTLLETTTALRREGKNIENIQDQTFVKIFTLLKKKEIGKEAIEEIMSAKAENPSMDVDEIRKELDLEKVSLDQLEEIISDVITNNINLIEERKMRSMGPLMGEVMKKVRGKIDGAIVSKKLNASIQQKIKELK
ncbi:MAG: Glu-tRNA(Gln) amidotransferase subunit GatE [Promethearchaeota archaeon]|nr:MAG: Glu-tRNA(Gln) amidotransferase subunit GatE [Candidatus Lokiarchaeota archaeon]